MELSRRQFLEMGLVTAGAASLPVRAFASQQLTGHIYAVSTLNRSDPTLELSDVVDLNLATGEVRYIPLPNHKLGHSLIPLPDGGFFAVPYGEDTTSCLFLGSDFAVKGEIPAPEGFGFGGHAALLPDGKTIFGHFNQAAYEDKRTPDQTGELCAIDIETRQVTKTIPTKILHGHDIILSRDKRHVIVGDDGTLEARDPEEMSGQSDNPFALVTDNPSLTLFDAVTLERKKTIPLPINGSFVHIEEGVDGSIFGAVEQYVSKNEVGLTALRELLGDDVERYVDSLDTNMFFAELPYPGPIIRVNLESGEIERHQQPQNQAPFDIKINEATGRIVNVFTASNMLARFNPLSNRWGYFSTEPYGIKQPYGVTDIPGTTYMAVNGFLEGIAILDVTTMSLVRRFDTRNYGIKHMLYQPAA